MDARIEREFKLRIPDEKAWHALLARLDGPSAPPARQVNHFFDTPAGDLRRAEVALRLREEGGNATLALKGPLLEDGSALAQRPEEELVLDPSVASEILAGRRAPLELFRTRASTPSTLVRNALALAAGAPLRRIGAFENERTRVGPLLFPPGSRGPALVFELDRTRFPGGRLERELEVELPPDVDPAGVERGLHELFSSLGIPLAHAPSKAARFFTALDALADGG